MAAIGIANVVVDHGAVSWRDGASGRTTEIAIDRMTLHARDFTSPMAVDFSGKVNGMPVALSGNLGPAEALLAQRGPYPVAVAGQVDGTGVKLSTKLARSGNTTTLDALDAAWGSIAVRGSLQAVSTAGGTRYVVALDIPSLSLAGGGPSAATSSATAKGAAGGAKWVIPDTPLPLAAVAALDADGSVSIGQVELRGGQRVGKVDARLASRGGRLDLQVSSGAVLGGSLTGDVAFDAGGGPGSLHLRISAQGVDLKALAAAAGNTGDIGGGTLRASVDVAGTGTTPHQFASSMSGNILAVAGPTTLTGAVGGAESTLSRITGLLDPLHAARKVTELRCAVVRLPIVGGVARVDRSIAAETDELGVSASGTIDFRNETIDLTLQPQLRQGASIDVSRIAGLVRVRGPFAHPGVAMDAAQSAQAIASLGILAGKGGGLAALGRALVAPSGGKVEPCAVAMSGAAARAVAAGTRTPARPGRQRRLAGRPGQSHRQAVRALKRADDPHPTAGAGAMEAYASEWLQLLIRWIHLITGHRVDRRVVLFRLARQQPEPAPQRAGDVDEGHRRRAVGHPRRRASIVAQKVPHRAARVAAATALVQMGGVLRPGWSGFALLRRHVLRCMPTYT